MLGSLELLAPRLPAGSQEAGWLARALEAGERIRDIVARMRRITRVERLPEPDDRLPQLLDIRRSGGA